MTWEEYGEKCDKIREENKRYLEVFLEDINGLSDKTVNAHLGNADFYINDYLLSEEALTMDQGIFNINSFLGDYFIRKCMWSTPASIKSTAASIKKFYKSMLEHGFIEKDDYVLLCNTIKENMDEWQDACEAYNDHDAVVPFEFW